VSSVKGDGLDQLKYFLNLLPTTTDKYKCDVNADYQITETFTVPGVGTVVNGTLLSGSCFVLSNVQLSFSLGVIHAGDTLLLGPDTTGVFIPTQVKSIHRKCIPVSTVSAGQTATLALKKVKRSAIRKGMVLVR
jgi:GTPase